MLSGYRRIFCNTSYEVDWTATKQIVLAPAPPSQTTPRSSPLETLIQILVFGLSNGSVLALNAIGVTIIYSTVRTLNLAHGDVFALATVVVTTWVRGLGIQQNWSPPQLIGALVIVFFIAVFAGALLSVGVEELAFKPFRGHSRFAPMIATLGLSFILFQGALVWRTLQPSWIPGEHRSVPGLPEVPTDGIPSLLPEVNLIKTFNLPFHLVVRLSDVFVLAIALVFVVLATWFLQRTRTGRAIRAYSQNPMLSQMLGINLDQTILRAFAFGGALAGAAAFIFAIYYGRPFGVHGAQSGLMAFAAALLGGIGNPLGALVSGLLIGMVSSLSDYYLSAQWTSVLMMTLLIGLLVWRPTGLTASNADEITAVRDSVILTEPGKSQAKNRQLLIILTLLAVVPILLQTFGLDGQTILQIIGIFIALTLGLNLAFGVAGILDFGFALSYGVGAYVWAILSPNIGYAPALLSGILAAAITGLIKGGLSWRLRGDYLAVATLAFGLLGSQVIINLGWLTGGAGGIGNLPKPSLFGFQFQSLLARYFIVFAAIVFAVWLSQRLTLSRSGRSWIAASEDEEVASAVGINVERTRLLASVISSALAGLAGALYASTFSFVDPEVLSFYTTSLVLTMVILGGAGSITGVMIGAATIVLYDKVFVSKLADLVALVWPKNLFIGPVPDIRGANFFNFGIALYLTVLLRARRKNSSKKLTSIKRNNQC
jgi:branched-chain amino acid transport system permease protein